MTADNKLVASKSVVLTVIYFRIAPKRIRPRTRGLDDWITCKTGKNVSNTRSTNYDMTVIWLLASSSILQKPV